ncbi:MAG TPA: helix-turn-helix transcriptional regulator, partial [Acidimicrobiales bacterium]|nr:helix-turn-helix transcriptional regulator [Acidimicrobiales bacterium]
APTAFLRTVVERLSSTSRYRSPLPGIVEPLTERELAVLALLPTQLPNGEVADRLGISPNTLKTHLEHVYRKLGVARRGEAVATAERLHLL